ncbi:DUF6701 domain-containing protein [Gallionella capsiferriformans]|nr:DUF6701 domain-containing protein [Gallionella capsiferriformans]
MLSIETLAVACTSVAASQTDWNKTAAWNAACGGQPPVGATVIIANGTNILADANTLNVTNVTVQAGGTLAIKSGKTISLSGNFTNNGTFTAPVNSTVSLTGTNQTITGNVTFANLTVAASTQLTLTGNIIVNGTTNLTQASIASTCPANFSITNGAGTVVSQSCAGGGAGGGGGAATSCNLTATAAGPTPIMAGANNLTYGNGTTVNGGAGAVVVTGSNNAIPVSGGTVLPAPTMYALPPTPFPLAGGATVNNAALVAAGTYGTINATGNPTVFSGGTYYIKSLNTTGSIQLAAGTYYINSLKLSGNLIVTGAVKLYIGNQIDLKNKGISLNGGGNAGNLQVSLYSGAQFDAGKNNTSFTGLLYSPFANSQVQFDNNAVITGAIITTGEVQLGNNVGINFNSVVQAQINGVVCPGAAVQDHIEIQHGGTGLTCSPQTITLRACADAACATLYTGGGLTVTPTPGGVPVVIGATGAAIATVQQATAGGVTLGATSNPASAAATTCLNTVTGAASCAMTFNNSGFLVTVPNQFSCINVSATIEAVQTAPATGRCIPAYQSVTRAVQLYTSYTNPATGTLRVTASTGVVSTAAPGTAHNLLFDATGKATITLSYPDAGQLTLTTTGTAPSGAAMTGSGTFIVAPASFAFSAIPVAPLTAGLAFNATVTAKNACATPSPTPNFNSMLTITSSNHLPGIGNATVINTALTGFVGGVVSTNLTWNEVGTVDLNAGMSTYLGWALPTAVAGTQASVGRFHPAYFDTAVTPACGAFTYAGSTAPIKAGQPFTTTVTAKAAGGGITANYTGWNAYFTTLSNAGATTGFTSNTIGAAGFANGVGSANVTYAVATPQTAPLTLTLRATDADTAQVSSSGHIEGTTEIRSGRVKLLNAYGSELLNMAVPFTAEYYTSTHGWMLNASDSCTITTLPILTLQPSGVVVSKSVNSPFVGGNGNLLLFMPNVTGYVDVVATVMPWLQFAWSGAGVSNPSARATFGVYKGNNLFIYRGRRGR